ncbi:SECIS binding protein and pelota RNA binding [Cryptosporidium hominis]
MENLLDNNFELLASELFDVPRDSGVAYLQIGTSYSGNSNNNNNSNNGHNNGSGSARGSQQLVQQQSQHSRNARSDSLIGDIKNSNITVSAVDGSLIDFNSIRNIETPSKIGVSGHIVERSNRIRMEHANNVVDELQGFNIASRHSGNRSFGRPEESYLDLDGSMNRRSSDTFSDVCAYQRQNSMGNSKNNNNNNNINNSNNSVMHSRCHNGSFSQNSHLGSTGGIIKMASCSNNNGNTFHDEQAEFDTDQRIQGLIGRYNSMCMDDQILKMGTYSNYINNCNMNNGNVNTNCTTFDTNSINNKSTNNNGANANVDAFLPQIDHCNTGTSGSIIGNGFSHEVGSIERDSTECYRAHQSYIQRRFANGDFGTCNMTNTTTVSSEISSLSGVATPGSASLKSANSADALSQRFRNSSNISLSSYDISDIQGSNGVNFDKLSAGAIGMSSYSKHLNAIPLDDNAIPLEDSVSEINSNGKLRFRKSSGSTSNLSNPTSIMGSMNASGRRAIGGSVCSSGSSSCSTGVGGSTCSLAGNNSSGAYGMKRSSKSNSLIHSNFSSNGVNPLIIDEEDIYPSIGHFALLGSSNSQLLGVMNNQTEGLVSSFKSRSGSANTDYMCRSGIDTSPSIKGNYISYGDSINGIESRHSSHPALSNGDIGGSFEMEGNGSQFQNMFNRLMEDSNDYRMEGSLQGIDEVEFRGDGKSYWQHTSPYKFSSSQGVIDWKPQHQKLSIFEKNEFNDDFGCDVPYNNYLINRGQQLRHKYFGQQKLYGFPSNMSNKQQKQLKQRNGVSPNLGNFEANQRAPNTYRSGNLPILYNENNMLRCESNMLRHTSRSGKKNSSGSLTGSMPNIPLNSGLNIQNLNDQGYVGVNQGQLQYCRKTCPPNCTIPTHINGNMFRRKSGSGVIPFNGNQLGLGVGGGSMGVIGNGVSRSLNDLAYSGIPNIPISGLSNQGYSKKTSEDAYYNKNNRKNAINHIKNNSNASHSCNSNMTGGMAGFGNMNIHNNFPAGSNSCTAGLSASSIDNSGNDASKNGLTPSSIAALWAKAMSKTGGRTGFSNRNKHSNSNSASSNTDVNNNGTNSGSANLTDSKNGANEIITCARFSSFLRNNSGRLHWLRVMYHYLDTVDARKIREVNKGDNLCMVAVDDIALEAVSRSFDPSECAYWSEPENGAFVHKNIRLAVAHKVGHRTVASPQNYVNQILTASLDHSVSILLNTLRAIDDRVRWMSTVVNSKNGSGLQIDLKSNKISNSCVIPSEGESNQKISDSKNTIETGYTITINGSAISISNTGNALGGIEEGTNESNTNLSNSTKNFPGRVFTVGVREAMRCLRHKKLKALIVAPDIEGDGVEGSLRHHVIHILLQAQELNIPTIFALNRHRIGRAMGKHMRMSVLGLLSIRGVEKQFQAISHTAQLLRKLYHFCIENNLPPTEETFKKLSSSVNIN